MKRKHSQIGANLKVVLGSDSALGPGKADLLDGIAMEGTIAGAGRKLGMSYRRAWLLISELNGMFKSPLVTAAKGGKGGGGGAVLTPLGQNVLSHYRNMQHVTERAIAKDLAALRRALR
jgi:molybdate transport system regulatory protein